MGLQGEYTGGHQYPPGSGNGIGFLLVSATITLSLMSPRDA